MHTHLCAMRKYILPVLLLAALNTKAQHPVPEELANEDSLSKGNTKSKTFISGYGSAFFQRDFNEKKSSMNLDRVIVFVGHQFNSKISFFSELEVEDAKVDADGGELALEQAYLKFNLNSTNYFTAGLFIPRIGIINENHLPVQFNGVERPMVEQLVIPSTWRELGIGFYGRGAKTPIHYSIAVLNGLNSSNFEHGTGLREGRFEGREASANNMAITAALQYYYKDFIFQVSGYAGGTNGLNNSESDSLELQSGFFGEALYLGEANIRWENNGWSAKALGTIISFPGAADINKAYANNVSKNMFGTYVELAYNILQNSRKAKEQKLNIFGRYESFDLNSKIPSNAIYDGTLKQQHVVLGFAYLPIKNVVIKTDVRLLHTGDENPTLVINPGPNRIPYKQNNTFFNLGIGYSF